MASSTVKSLVSNWADNLETAGIYSEILNNDLYRIEDVENDYVIYSSVDIDNPNKTISFGILKSGDIVNPFQTSMTVSENGDVISQIHSLDDLHLLTIIDRINGDREIASHNSNGRIEGWWSNFEKCVGAVTAPTPSAVGNLAIGTVATAATLGLWVPAVLVVCGGVASFQ